VTAPIPGRTPVAALLAPAAGIAVVACWLLRKGTGPEGSAPLASALAALGLLLVPYALLASAPIVDALRRFVDGRPITTLALAGSLLCPYLLYWGIAGKAKPGALFGLVAYVAAASLAALALPLARARWAGDALVVLAVWLPLEGRWLDASFPWPAGGPGRLLGGVLGLDLLLYQMLVVRKFDGLGFSLLPGWKDLRAAAVGFAAFAAVGIPIGLWSGFLAPARAAAGAGQAVMTIVGIYLFTGIPEETLFRGCVQGLLERWTGRRDAALAVASLVFGLAHLNNGPSPDGRYALLATLAGVAYGWVYQRTRRVAAPALVHTLVDATWVLCLKGR